MNNINNVNELKRYILNYIGEGKLNEESIPILDYLMEINKTSFISFDSQPYNNIINDGVEYIQRAYINGIYPKSKIKGLVKRLPMGIVLSETRLNKEGDVLYIYGKKDKDTPLVNKLEVNCDDEPELYPMFKNGDKWIKGYAGNVINPQARDLLENFNKELNNEIEKEYSLVQIWPENINNELFQILKECLYKTDNE